MRNCVIAAVFAPTGIAVAVPVVIGKSKPEPTFRVLEKARSSQDVTKKFDGVLADIVVPGTVRYVGVTGEQKAYVAAGTEGRTCFLTEDDFGVGGGCIEEDSLKNQATYVGSANTSGGVDLVVPVPDAYETVKVNDKKLKAKDNVVLTTVSKHDSKLTVEGDGGPLETQLNLEP